MLAQSDKQGAKVTKEQRAIPVLRDHPESAFKEKRDNLELLAPQVQRVIPEHKGRREQAEQVAFQDLQDPLERKEMLDLQDLPERTDQLEQPAPRDPSVCSQTDCCNIDARN